MTLANVGGQLDYLNRTGSVVWALIDILKPGGLAVGDSVIVPILKEVLTVYQLDGIRNPMVEYNVPFKF